MSNIIPLDSIQLPAHLLNHQASNDTFLAGLSRGGGFPMLGLKGTRFAIKADGAETVLPTTEISVILVAAKQNLDKNYYASKFDPSNTEAKAPDCFSRDGVKPDASATLKQHPSCAGCPLNEFGSGTDNQGNPGKGKACSDTKMLAIYANNGVYGFKIPPASLKGFAHYVLETGRRGVDLTTAITVIGFDANFSYPVLTFNFGGFLNPEQVAKINQLKASTEVGDIIGGISAPAQVSPAIAATPAPPVASDPFAQVVAPTVPEKPKAVRAAKEKPVGKAVEIADDDLSSLAAELGISL